LRVLTIDGPASGELKDAVLGAEAQGAGAGLIELRDIGALGAKIISIIEAKNGA